VLTCNQSAARYDDATHRLKDKLIVSIKFTLYLKAVAMLKALLEALCSLCRTRYDVDK